jgi:L-malate glycosyltransferase
MPEKKFKKCKVLHVLNHLGIGGTELYVVDLSNSLDKSKFENHVAYAHGGDGDLLSLLDKDVRTFKYSEKKASFRSIYNLTVPFKLINYIRKEKIDIVQTYLPPSHAWAWVASKMSATVCTHLIVESLIIGQVFSNLLIKHRWLANLFDNMITNYGTLLRYSGEEYISMLGIQPGKFIHLGHGVDLEKYQINADYAAQIKQEFHIHESTVVLGSVGRLSREKEIDLFLNLIPTIKQEFPEFTFLVVGDGPESERLKKLTAELHIEDNVIFTGLRYDTKRIFNAIDCHIFCMRRPLLGIANMQAMACGSPLVVLASLKADTDMVSEFIENGKNGYIARDAEEYKKMVLDILRNPQKTMQMGINARLVAEERFDFKKHVLRVESLYLNLWKKERG